MKYVMAGAVGIVLTFVILQLLGILDFETTGLTAKLKQTK